MLGRRKRADELLDLGTFWWRRCRQRWRCGGGGWRRRRCCSSGRKGGGKGRREGECGACFVSRRRLMRCVVCAHSRRSRTRTWDSGCSTDHGVGVAMLLRTRERCYVLFVCTVEHVLWRCCEDITWLYLLFPSCDSSQWRRDLISTRGEREREIASRWARWKHSLHLQCR